MSNTVIGIIIAAAVIVILLFVLFLAKCRKGGGSAGAGTDENSQIYVGNLSYRVHERELRRFFEDYGTISRLKVVKDRNTGRSKGFGFVTFENLKQANEALAAHGQELLGRNVVVRLAKPK